MMSRRARAGGMLWLLAACAAAAAAMYFGHGLLGDWVGLVAIALVLGTCVVVLWRLRRLERRVAATGGRLCPCCHYDMSGGERLGRCPECGEQYDVRELPAMWRQVFPRWERLAGRGTRGRGP